MTPENILLPHREQTIRCMMRNGTVLCIRDGTKLDFNSLNECEGLVVTGSNQTGTKSDGMEMCSTLAVTPQGLPLGVLRADFHEPVRKETEEKRAWRATPIEEKKTCEWIRGVRDLREIAAEVPETRLVAVMDREADVFELFEEWRTKPSWTPCSHIAGATSAPPTSRLSIRQPVRNPAIQRVMHLA